MKPYLCRLALAASMLASALTFGAVEPRRPALVAVAEADERACIPGTDAYYDLNECATARRAHGDEPA